MRDDLTRSRSPYIFDQDGRHIKTIDIDSGITLVTFEYDSSGLLSEVTDQFENTITLNRETNGKIEISSPDGYKTTLVIDENNDLASAAYDDGTSYDFSYTNSLMTDEVDRKNNLFTRKFNSYGRIESSEDPEGGSWTFFNVKDEVSKILSYGFTTAENNRSETKEVKLENGDRKITRIKTDESQSETTKQADELKDTSSFAGVSTVVDKVIDPKTLLEVPKTITSTYSQDVVNTTQIERLYGENGTDMSVLTVNLNQNGNTSGVVSNFATGHQVSTSAENRTTTSQVDPLNRTIAEFTSDRVVRSELSI